MTAASPVHLLRSHSLPCWLGFGEYVPQATAVATGIAPEAAGIRVIRTHPVPIITSELNLLAFST